MRFTITTVAVARWLPTGDCTVRVNCCNPLSIVHAADVNVAGAVSPCQRSKFVTVALHPAAGRLKPFGVP